MDGQTPQIEPIVPAYRVRILSDEQLERFKSNTFIILEETGFHCPSERALKIYAEHGAVVDFHTQIVKLPPDDITDADADPTNEFQELTWNNATNQIMITNGSDATITGFLESELDGDPANDFQYIEPFSWDYYQDTDLWYVLFWEFGTWKLEVTDFGILHRESEFTVQSYCILVCFLPRPRS